MQWKSLYIFIITYTHIVYSQMCVKNVIESECKVDVVCSGNYVDIYSHSLDQYPKSFINDFCRSNAQPPWINQYDSYFRFPIYLQLNAFTQAELPLFNDETIRHITYSLDLDNTSGTTPSLTSMPNLNYLRISNNNLNTAKLYNEHKLPSIREIDLSHNRICDIEVDREQYPYITLTKIDLSYNNIVFIPDGIFYGFDDLITIDLSANQINILSASTFEGVRNLMNLDFESNRLTFINASFFRFSKLKLLNLKNNKIENIAPNDFDVMRDLESLDLSLNVIQHFNMNVLRNTVSLKEIDISSNMLEDIETNLNTNLKYLTEMDISNNKLRSLPIGLFSNMSISTFDINDNILQGSLKKGMLMGLNVQKLNLENQYLSGIEDYAFYNTNKLEIVLLNSNTIETLSGKCFKTLQYLQELNLSYNRINDISFDKTDLVNLRKIILRGNNLMQITREHLQDLVNLEYLDLTQNFIIHIEPGSFEYFRNLMNLELYSNSLNGTLDTNVFKGLISLPRLDLAENSLTFIGNASFNEMGELKYLNISRGKIVEIEYNAFIHTGFIEILDLSFNSLDVFHVNSTELVGLNVILLNNNHIKTLSTETFNYLSSLTQIDISYNDLQTISDELFINQVDLRDFNLSFNEKLQIPNKLTDTMKHLKNIDVSGIKTGLNFSQLKDLPLSVAKITDANIKNITTLNVKSLSSIETLILKNNIVSKLEVGAFSGMHKLDHLDLSCNIIDYIQPGVFKDNSLLYTLNISHNALFTISYGIFRGLIYLNTLDLSHNNISDLQTERFYEVKSLTVLIADHNRITSIDLDEFEGTRLTELSIGDNPLPCKDLINLKRKESSIRITALTIDENNDENFEGIKCNRNVFEHKKTLSANISQPDGSSNLLYDIRNILYNLDSKTVALPSSKEEQYIEKLSDVLQKSNALNTQKMSENITLAILSTNIFLEKILNSLLTKPTVVPQQSLITSSRNTEPVLVSESVTENLVTHVNKMKHELQVMFNDKINIMKQSLDELKTKLSSIPVQAQAMKPKNERLASDNGQRFIFTEACVAIILVILLSTLLYKFYKSRVYIRNRLSISTRELPGAIENSNL